MDFDDNDLDDILNDFDGEDSNDFENYDDEEVDSFGGNLSDEEDILSDFSDNNNQSNPPRPPVDKKRALIIGGIGLFLVLAVFIVAGFIKSAKEKKATLEESQVYEETQQEISSQSSVVETPIQQPVQQPIQQLVQQPVQADVDWTVIEADKTINLDSEVTAVFTVTGIKHLAKQTGVETAVKSVATGSISGLSGTYDIELPYSLARFVTVGNTLKLKYKIGQINGQSVVSDLKVE